MVGPSAKNGPSTRKVALSSLVVFFYFIFLWGSSLACSGLHQRIRTLEQLLYLGKGVMFFQPSERGHGGPWSRSPGVCLNFLTMAWVLSQHGTCVFSPFAINQIQGVCTRNPMFSQEMNMQPKTSLCEGDSRANHTTAYKLIDVVHRGSQGTAPHQFVRIFGAMRHSTSSNGTVHHR